MAFVQFTKSSVSRLITDKYINLTDSFINIRGPSILLNGLALYVQLEHRALSNGLSVLKILGTTFIETSRPVQYVKKFTKAVVW